MKTLLLFILPLVTVSAFRYDGYRMLEVGPVADHSIAQLVAGLADNDERIREVILMNEHVTAHAPIYLAVAPQSFSRVSAFLDQNEIQFVVTNNDLQKTYDEAKLENERAMARWRKAGMKAAPTAYLSYADQVSWLESAASASSIASTFSIGKSYEGRDTTAIVINANSNLPTIFIDANVHAREWITSASVLYVIDQILTGTSADAIYLRTNFRWYIVPNANPDGYEYSRSTDRQWRKTRSANSGSVCTGTDANRNWDENWGGSGSSALPCSDTYRGASAFSEKESQNLRDLATSIASTTNVYISVHSYSQLWLIPWGGYSYKPADYTELLRVANLAATAIKSVNGLTFTVGTPPDLLYVAAGGSFDWIKAKLDIAYSYSPELRPATAAEGGFEISASNITPSGAETFAAIVAVAKNAVHKI